MSEIAIIILSLKFISSFEADMFSFTNLFFPPSCFSLLSCSCSLCCLSSFAPTASRKKRAAKRILSTLGTMRNTELIEDCVHKFHQEANRSWLAQLSENPVDWVCGQSLFAKFFRLISWNNFLTRRRHFNELQSKGICLIALKFGQ